MAADSKRTAMSALPFTPLPLPAGVPRRLLEVLRPKLRRLLSLGIRSMKAPSKLNLGMSPSIAEYSMQYRGTGHERPYIESLACLVDGLGASD